jgi:membrane protease YdiL (CAAX protease family)
VSSLHLPPLRSADDRAPIDMRYALAGWLGAWLAGALVSSAVQAAAGGTPSSTPSPGWLAVASVMQWTPLVLMAVYLGRRFGSGLLSSDYGYSFRLIDLVGVPIGVLTQLLLLRLVYLPLESLWPHTFDRHKVEQRAKDLSHQATGGKVALLVLVVVVGAPLVEELIYRGLLQGAFTRRLDDVLGLVLGAALFAAVHFAPIETPGLFVVGLVLGSCLMVTRRLGMGVLAHMAFNATGLVLVAAK